MRKWWLATVLLTGCHGAPPPPPAPPATVAPAEPSDGARSGTRLKLLLWQSGDGFTSWTGWFFDTQLAAPCRAVAWTDGRLYCTPIDSPVPLGVFDSTPAPDRDRTLIGYTDAGCTQPEVIAYDAPSLYAAALVDDGCSPDGVHPSWKVSHLYRRGAKFGTPDSYFTNEVTVGVCESWTGFLSTAYAAEPGPSPSDLVLLSLRTAPTTDRLTTTYLVSEDGLQFPAYAHDTQFDADCYFASPLGGAPTCVPVGAVSSLRGGADGLDASCTKPLATVPARCPRPSAVFTTFVNPSDFDPTKFLPVGAPAAELCAQTPPAADTSYYQLGAAVPLVTASLERENITGRRLELYHRVAGSWTGRDPDHLHDNHYDLDCRLHADGLTSAYCSVYPACGSPLSGYSDPSCKTQVTWFDSTGCSSPPPPLFDRLTVLTDQRETNPVYLAVPIEAGGPAYRCDVLEGHTLYRTAPDPIPLDRFEQFAPIVDSR
ncbi:MAG TPA: hypothetical protein VF516_32395 [Kofleriaceae bacterium]